MLQSKAGYIDARPFTASSTKSTCNARPDHTLGQSVDLTTSRRCPVYLPTTDIRTNAGFRRYGPDADSCAAACAGE
jgi:hypothetical protein